MAEHRLDSPLDLEDTGEMDVYEAVGKTDAEYSEERDIALAAVATNTADVVAKAFHDNTDRINRRSGRNRNIAIAVASLIALASLLLSYINTRNLVQSDAATAINTSSIAALNEARKELRDSGIPESQLPPEITVGPNEPVDVDAIIQATTASVLAKIRTDPSYRGSVGPRGSAGASGALGPSGISPQCLSSSLQCRGTKGDRGDKGDTGDPGDTGAAGPQGPAGPTGPTGPAGSPIIPPSGG